MTRTLHEDSPPQVKSVCSTISWIVSLLSKMVRNSFPGCDLQFTVINRSSNFPSCTINKSSVNLFVCYFSSLSSHVFLNPARSYTSRITRLHSTLRVFCSCMFINHTDEALTSWSGFGFTAFGIHLKHLFIYILCAG